jgi:hypothetical protein
MTLDITVICTVRLLLIFVFARAVWHKLANKHQFVAQLNSYQLLPEPLAPAFALFLVLVEGCLVCTLPVPGWRVPAWIAAALMSLYAGAMAINLVRGRTNLDCGCNGPAQFPQTVSWALVVRNLSLATIALVSAAPVYTRILTIYDIGTIALATGTAILLYGSIEQAIVNQQRQTQYFALRVGIEAGSGS